MYQVKCKVKFDRSLELIKRLSRLTTAALLTKASRLPRPNHLTKRDNLQPFLWQYLEGKKTWWPRKSPGVNLWQGKPAQPIY